MLIILNILYIEAFALLGEVIRRYHRPFLWALLALLFVMDIITTTIGVKAGGVELNPHMAAIATDPIAQLISKLNAFALIMCIIEAYILVLKKIRLKPKSELGYRIGYSTVILTMCGITMFYTVVVISNLCQLRYMNIL